MTAINAIKSTLLLFFLATVLLSCEETQSNSTKETIEVKESDTATTKPTTNNNIDTTEENATINEASPSVKDSAPVTMVQSRSMPKVNRNFKFSYDLDEPDFIGNLPKELIEISALSYNQKGNTLYAVNDEVGKLYTLDATDCRIVETLEFGKNGDYEGVEIIGQLAYVLKANGNLSVVDIITGKKIKTHKTNLTAANDVEGLGYDNKTNELVLACKGTPAIKKKHKLKNTKAFYAFDLDRKELNDYPKFTISDEQLKDFFKQYLEEDLSKKEKKKLKHRLVDFSPSAIAKHPTEDHFYILSSVGKLLVICNSYGRIMNVQFLNSKKFTQPEGICFSPDGTLYISNEGKSVKGKILRFEK